MAEFKDGNRIFEQAYTTRAAAERACDALPNGITSDAMRAASAALLATVS